MAGNTLIIVLAAALVLAVGVLLFGVGRIIYGIAHYYLQERRPTRKFQDPTYGLLTGESGIWTGTTRSNGKELRFTVGGTDSAPDEKLLRRVGAIIGRFTALERRAVGYLREHEPEIGKASLEVYGLDVAESDHQEDFTLEFVAEADDSRVWRVEFEGGEPKRAGFDD